MITRSGSITPSYNLSFILSLEHVKVNMYPKRASNVLEPLKTNAPQQGRHTDDFSNTTITIHIFHTIYIPLRVTTTLRAVG